MFTPYNTQINPVYEVLYKEKIHLQGICTALCKQRFQYILFICLSKLDFTKASYYKMLVLVFLSQM